MKRKQNTVTSNDATRNLPIFYKALWAFATLAGLIGCYMFSVFSHHFGYDFKVINMPIISLVAILCATGLAYLLVLALTQASCRYQQKGIGLLMLIIVAGIAMRLLMFGSEPVLEDDYQRYLLDGAVTAHGLNPYKYSPRDIAQGKTDNDKYNKIVKEAGVILNRVNHADLRTIYPPAAQSLFAAAYLIHPFSLDAWRSVLLLADISTLALILLLLQRLSIPLIWCIAYWWNPIVIKELFNSTHMEAVLMPFVMGAIYLALRKKYSWSSITLMLAAGIKIWPLALYPILLRPIIFKPRTLIFTVAPAFILFLLMIWPVFLTPLDKGSGFVAYATQWRTNSALYPLLTHIGEFVSQTFFSTQALKALPRLFVLIFLSLILFNLFHKPVRDDYDLLKRAALLTTAIFLLSPAQFPWYFVWVAPMLAFFTSWGLSVLTALMPLYYFGFYLLARDQHNLHYLYVVWVIWVPVWLLLARDYIYITKRLWPNYDKVNDLT